MKKMLGLSMIFALALAACSRQDAAQEQIKITEPAPVSGQEVSWDILFDKWASDTDRDLVRDVRQALVGDPETVPLAEAVAIEANGGAVTLRGSGAYVLNMEEWQVVGRT